MAEASLGHVKRIICIASERGADESVTGPVWDIFEMRTYFRQ